MSDVKYDKIDDDAGEGSSKGKKCLCYTLLIGVIVVAAVVIVIVVVSKGGSDENTQDTNNYKYESTTSDNRSVWEAKLKLDKPSENADDVTQLTFTMTAIDSSISHLLLKPSDEAADNQSWRIPEGWLPRLTPSGNASLKDTLHFETVKEDATDKFWFKFNDVDDKTKEDIILSTEKRALTFTKDKIEIGYTLPSQKVFGFGERTKTFGLGEGDHTSFARDRWAGHVSDGKGGDNLYGQHPFLIWQLDESQNKFAGMIALSSRAMNLNIRHTSSGKTLATFTQLGGAIEFYFFTLGSATEIVEQYSQLVGKPYLPPFWALGFHLCSWKWDTLDKMTKAYKDTIDGGYRLETQWIDIPYMHKFMDFTVDDGDEGKFVGLAAHVQTLHDANRKFVPIIDAGIGPLEDPFYEEGKEIYIKNAAGDAPYVGKVWPGKASFPDYTHPDTQAFWNKGFEALYAKLKFDGIWLDMNEPADMSKEKPEPEPEPEQKMRAFLNRSLAIAEEEDEEVLPGVTWLGEKTVPLDCTHEGKYKGQDSPANQKTEMDWHSMYGAMESEATHNWMLSNNDFKEKKNLIISRSTFPGSGRFNQHWLGDNQSRWEDIQYGIAGIYNFNLFQIPFVGADIGGFGGNISDAAVGDDKGHKFLARFHQVGAFFPFSRNHNTIGDWNVDEQKVDKESEEQAPYVLENKDLQDAVKYAFVERYMILRHYYTQLYLASKNGTPVYLPTYFHYPEQEETHKDYEKTVMIGKELLVLMPLDAEDTMTAYIPGPMSWYRHDGEIYKGEGEEKKYQNYVTGGSKVTVENTWKSIPVLQPQGTIFAFQVVNDAVKTTEDLTTYGMRYTVFPNGQKTAHGQVYLAYGKFQTTGTGDVEREQLWTIDYFDKTLIFDDALSDTIDFEKVNDNNKINQIKIAGLDDLRTDPATQSYFVCAQMLAGVDIELDGTYTPEERWLVIEAKEGQEELEIQNVQEINFGVTGQDYNPCKPAYNVGEVSTTENVLTFKLTPSEDNNLSETPLKPLIGTATVVDDAIVRVKIVQEGVTSFEAPLEMGPVQDTGKLKIDDIVRITEVGTPFEIRITTAGNEEIIRIENFTFIDQYIRMEETISGRNLIGFGERVHQFELSNGQYTMWALDNPAQYDQGSRTGNQGYGVHPVYFARRSNNNNYFGLLNLNASNQQVNISTIGDKRKVKHELTSGLVDLYFITEGTYEQTAKNYHKLVGFPVLPPLWGLGWQQSRYGYESAAKLDDVVKKYAENGIPLDVIWSDIDYMEQYQDFTIGKGDNYKELPQYVSEWQTNRGLKWVPIIDAGLGQLEGDEVLKEGMEKDVFIKSPIDKKPLVGKVWPGLAVFPDFNKETTGEWWRKAFADFKTKYEIKFDGIWLDMNEVANFVDGQANDAQKVEDSISKKMLFYPGNHEPNYKSLQVDAYHNDDEKLREYDLHSLFGYYQGKETAKMYTDAGERQFIISRSTFVGSGKWVSHWLGDNHSNYSSMRTTTAGIMLFNTFGYSLVGGDICGFMEDTNEELCTRWTNVGAFYPFARNHNTIDAIDQEPYVWGEEHLAQQKHAIGMRYQAIRYLYQFIWKANQFGGTVWRPQSAEFPADQNAYTNPEGNPMIGTGLKLAINYAAQDKGTFYFPGNWRNIEDGSQMVSGNVEINTDWKHINLFLRANQIVQWSYPQGEEGKSLTTAALKTARVVLKLFHSASGDVAKGDIVLDDGVSVDPAQATYLAVEATYTKPFLRTGTIEGKFTKVQAPEKETYEQYELLGKFELYNSALYNWAADKKMTVTMVADHTPATYECVGALGKVSNVYEVDCSAHEIPVAKIASFKI